MSRVRTSPERTTRSDRRADAGGIFRLAEVVEHQARRKQNGGRVGQPLPRDVGGGPVHGLEHSRGYADVARGGETEPAHQPRYLIRENVSEHVLHNEHVETVGIQNQHHSGRINDAILELDVGILLRHLPAHLEEQALCVLENVGLVGQSHLAPSVRTSVLEGVAADPLRAEARDDHHRLRRRFRVALESDEMLHSDVESLGVFADQHQIDILVTASGDDRTRRAHIGVQIELFAERYVDGAEAAPRECAEGTLEQHPVPAHGCQCNLGQRVVHPLNRCDPRELFIVREVCPHRVQHLYGRSRHLGSDAVPGDHRDGLGQDLSPFPGCPENHIVETKNEALWCVFTDPWGKAGGPTHQPRRPARPGCSLPRQLPGPRRTTQPARCRHRPGR